MMNMLAGKAMAVCMSGTRGVKKSRVSEGVLTAGHGLDGDAHSGPGPRQVSLLAYEDVAAVNELRGIGAMPGDFAENVLTTGVDLTGIPVGAMLRVGRALIRITGRGKPEHKPTDYNFKGIALLAEKGLFAEVVHGGAIREGDDIIMIEDKMTGRVSDADL